ncbi:MAG: hypothetical protein AAF682_24990 [Planctomycetota bacterium]
MQALLTALLLPLATSAQGQLFIVDDNGGAGVDFTTLQGAIDASSPGDSILVKEGSYSVPAGPFGPSFHFVGHDLTIVAEADANVLLESPVRVAGLDAGETVVLRGIDIDLSSFPPFSSLLNVLSVSSSEGILWAEDCDLRGAGGVLFVDEIDSPHTVDAHFGTLVLENCRISGGMVFDFGGLGHTLHAENSEVYLHGTTITPPEEFLLPGVAATFFEDSFVFASGSTFQGIDGKDAGTSIAGPTCGTDGGAGLALGGNLVGTTGYFLDCDLIGGAAGADPKCMTAQPGADFEIFSGQAFFLDGSARRLSAPPTAVAGTQVTLSFQGEPGDLVILAAAASATPVYLGAVAGALLPSVPAAIATAGTTDAGGQLLFPVPLPTLTAGVEALSLQLQAVFVGATPVASSGSTVLVTRTAP